ncbi:hypothetical protein PAHAL_2G015800 [Panicum hallii]|uniref:Uncharacterized protein n=1 Tax=Panicum hallii TaxID=206008 RepID=A0A2S3GVM3_9POAL|nr:putative UPF0481 protein At3g02645 isoform X1 [Panicum hallii]PAN09345.1 hypothetical protein PAHAL_2G015800 [Panicum hallii]
MPNDTGDFELEPAKKTWGEGIETRGEDSWTKTVTIEVVDASMPSKYELDARGAPNVDYCDLEAGKQAVVEEAEIMAQRDLWSGTVPISKVPERHRAGDESSFTPHDVAIGPYHAISSSFPRIEKQKLCCVGFLHSLSEQRTEGGLMGLAEKLEPLVRACYDPDAVSHMTPEQLSTMLLRDGCYLLACMVNYLDIMAAAAAAANNNKNADKLAHRCSSSSGKDVDSSSTGGGDSTVVRDTVFLVENQIPLFVLQRIHERVTGETTSSALERIALFVRKQLQVQLYISKKQQRPAPPQTSHLLHLVHAYIQPTNSSLPQASMKENTRAWQRTGRWHRAVEYRTHGNVRFKRRVFKEDDVWTILDVRLQGGTLWIPRLRVDGNTWTILRNLMALEEQIPRRPVTAYCLFMSQVAGTPEDVKLLVRSGTVEHFLASDEQVAQGFAGLCRGVVMDVDNIDRNYLKPLWHEMEERCDSRVHRFMGWFCQLKNIWSAIALLVALIVVACQLTQTFYAVVSYSRGGQQPKP